MSASQISGALDPNNIHSPTLIEHIKNATTRIDALVEAAGKNVTDTVAPTGKIDKGLMTEYQHKVHGYAWLVTYQDTLKTLGEYAENMESQGRLGPLEKMNVAMCFGEYMSQMAGGIPMAQGEIVRPQAWGIGLSDTFDFRADRSVAALCSFAQDEKARKVYFDLLKDAHANKALTYGDPGLSEDLEQVRRTYHAYGAKEIAPFAHDWHLQNELIPDSVLKGLADMGTFGVTIPEEYGGLDLNRTTMCVVTEALSKAYIGTGSLGTRTEIASDLILQHGTDEQKKKYLPGIADGTILPTAVFTEPNAGSDLGSLQTRAVKNEDGTWTLTGNKTFITHAARAGLMTVLALTDQGISMFLVDKQRGTDDNPVPLPGASGGEIEVLGYRGMKEYELSFDGVVIPADALLGTQEGRGFKQLLSTFEGARVQTAARAVGTADLALQLGLQYAADRVQFGQSIDHFPRVADKLTTMAFETNAARLTTYASAVMKDAGQRCDLKAGMAKMLGGRVAAAAADNALQIHGGNGFATEFPISRVFCDARVLRVFEGADEVQAMVVATRAIENRLESESPGAPAPARREGAPPPRPL